MLSVYYLNYRNTRGDQSDLAWSEADAKFIRCVVNAADRKAAPTFSSWFERSILAVKKGEAKDEGRDLMGLLTLVSLALNNVETPK